MGKFFGTIHGVFAWIWNHAWGTLFIVGGIWGLFNGWGIWIPLLCIGVGIYFFTSSRFDAKVGAVGEGVAEALADLAADKLSKHESSLRPSAPSSAPGSTDTSRGSVPTWLTTKNVIAVIAIAGIAYGIWGLQDAGETTMTFYGDGTVSTDTSYGSPLAWIALLGGGAAAALYQAIARREKRGESTTESAAEPVTAEPALDESAGAVRQELETVASAQPTEASESPMAGVLRTASGLSGKSKVLIVTALGIGVLTFAGVKIADSSREARNYEQEGNYAQMEDEGIAQAEADAQLEQEVFEAETDAAWTEDYEGDEGLTPNGNRRWMQLPDILAMAPEDGSTWHAIVTYTAAGGDRGSYVLEVNDIELGGSDTAHIHDVDLLDGDFSSCYVDGQPVTLSEFFDFACNNFGALGSIDFNQSEIVRADAYSYDFVPPNGY
ncbi:MAG: hypothetical protein U1E29_07915 [Coriobacteriia bacterium]|nr:hypothetical protein [Coriobacteriia bacterium]